MSRPCFSIVARSTRAILAFALLSGCVVAATPAVSAAPVDASCSKNPNVAPAQALVVTEKSATNMKAEIACVVDTGIVTSVTQESGLFGPSQCVHFADGDRRCFANSMVVSATAFGRPFLFNELSTVLAPRRAVANAPAAPQVRPIVPCPDYTSTAAQCVTYVAGANRLKIIDDDAKHTWWIPASMVSDDAGVLSFNDAPYGRRTVSHGTLLFTTDPKGYYFAIPAVGVSPQAVTSGTLGPVSAIVANGTTFYVQTSLISPVYAVSRAAGGRAVLDPSAIAVNLPVGGAKIFALSGSGNVIASGGGNVIATGGANVIASGGANVIATGGANIAPLTASSLAGFAGRAGGSVIATGGAN